MSTCSSIAAFLVSAMIQWQGSVQSTSAPGAQADSTAPRIVRFEEALTNAVKLAIGRFVRQTGVAADSLSWDTPEVDSLQPPVPAGGLVFVVRVPMLVQETRSRATKLSLHASNGYTTVVRDALVDAIVDRGSSLALNDAEWLTVAAVESPDPGLVSQVRYTMYLTIKGSDLRRLTGKDLPRDQARSLVTVTGKDPARLR
jgi:hypothetical protein